MGGAAAAASYTFFKVGESVMQKEQIRGPARTWKKTEHGTRTNGHFPRRKTGDIQKK